MVRMGKLKAIAARGKIKAVADFVHDITDGGEKLILFAYLKEVVLESQSSMYGLSAAMTTDNGVAAIGQQTRNAVLVVSMVPMIVIYPFLQKYFVSGIMLGAVKG